MKDRGDEYHIPVLFDECMQALGVRQGGIYFDGTLGGGGHTLGILRRGGTVLATDRDMEAIDHARLRLSYHTELNGRYTLVKDNFKNAKQVLKDNGVTALSGAILDLGIS